MIAASAGWRIVLADRESGGSVALPIVAWDQHPTGDYRWLDCYYVPNEAGVPPVRTDDATPLLGYLAPGDEHEAFWQEQAEDHIRMEDEREERRYRAAQETAAIPQEDTTT